MKTISSILKEGNFYCPQCKSNSRFKHIKVAKFSTLFSFPVIPLGKLGEYVECQTCLSTYSEEVVGAKKDFNGFVPVYHQPIRKLLIKMILADGKIEHKERVMLKETLEKITGANVHPSDLDIEIALVKNDPTSIQDYLKGVVPQLNDFGKEKILKACLYIANADGEIVEPELTLVREMAVVFELSPERLNQMLADLKQEVKSKAKISVAV